MKTPREILLSKHQAVTPKLDALRHNVLKQVEPRADVEEPSRGSDVGFIFKLWIELVLPSRRIWSGLAATWIVILIMNFSLSDDEMPALAKTERPVTRTEMMAAFNQRQQLMG